MPLWSTRARDPLPPEAGGANPRFTAVISDVHLSDADVPDPRRPGWRHYKQAGLKDDVRFAAVLEHFRELAGGEPVELICNGDTLDFDTIVATPDPAPFPVSWLERRRGLESEEPKSLWKLERILSFHPGAIAALQRWVADGNSLCFVIGNHDLDLHWPSVQARLFAAIAPEGSDRITVCEWFRMSGDDTLVIHGNQFDAYCVCQDPLHPFIDVRGALRVRSPFGNTAGKLMLNGMGYFNPHVESSFIRSLPDYLRFFVRYIARYQPLLGVEWFWTAIMTLWVTLDEGFRPAHRDPVNLAERLDDVAHRAHSRPSVAVALREMAVHSAVFKPLMVARELWLDRAFLLFGLFGAAFYGMLTLHWISGAHTWTAVIFFLALLPLYVAYARGIRSEVAGTEAVIKERLGELARIARVSRVVVGHTHRAAARSIEGVQYFNTGHWSPAFDDVECTEPVGLHAFAWIAPQPNGEREATLRVWEGPGSRELPVVAEARPAEGFAAAAVVRA